MRWKTGAAALAVIAGLAGANAASAADTMSGAVTDAGALGAWADMILAFGLLGACLRQRARILRRLGRLRAPVWAPDGSGLRAGRGARSTSSTDRAASSRQPWEDGPRAASTGRDFRSHRGRRNGGERPDHPARGAPSGETRSRRLRNRR